MKTMKTNFRKTVIRSATAVVSLFLATSMVSATNLQKNQSDEIGFNETAMSELVSAEWSEGEKEAFYFSVDLFEKAFDPVIETESWMLDCSYFGNYFELTDEAEAPIILEPWMTNSFHFNSRITEDHRMAIEDWMVSPDFWNM